MCMVAEERGQNAGAVGGMEKRGQNADQTFNLLEEESMVLKNVVRMQAWWAEWKTRGQNTDQTFNLREEESMVLKNVVITQVWGRTAEWIETRGQIRTPGRNGRLAQRIQGGMKTGRAEYMKHVVTIRTPGRNGRLMQRIQGGMEAEWSE